MFYYREFYDVTTSKLVPDRTMLTPSSVRKQSSQQSQTPSQKPTPQQQKQPQKTKPTSNGTPKKNTTKTHDQDDSDYVDESADTELIPSSTPKKSHNTQQNTTTNTPNLKVFDFTGKDFPVKNSKTDKQLQDSKDTKKDVQDDDSLDLSVNSFDGVDYGGFKAKRLVKGRDVEAEEVLAPASDDEHNADDGDGVDGDNDVVEDSVGSVPGDTKPKRLRKPNFDVTKHFTLEESEPQRKLDKDDEQEETQDKPTTQQQALKQMGRKSPRLPAAQKRKQQAMETVISNLHNKSAKRALFANAGDDADGDDDNGTLQHTEPTQLVNLDDDDDEPRPLVLNKKKGPSQSTQTRSATQNQPSSVIVVPDTTAPTTPSKSTTPSQTTTTTTPNKDMSWIEAAEMGTMKAKAQKLLFSKPPPTPQHKVLNQHMSKLLTKFKNGKHRTHTSHATMLSLSPITVTRPCP